MKKWNKIWESRAEEIKKLTLPELLAANGYDNERSIITPTTLVSAQNRYWDYGMSLSISDTVYEVGCGSGAFLWFLYDSGIKIGGIDLSSSLIDLAKTNLPNCDFVVGNATDLNTTKKYSHVISFSVFFYFPNYEYATIVLDRMVEKSALAVLLQSRFRGR
jgi:2-polyprenyl-3-methyl-5-hydroxy-6-metoxy-1,4-benzoquinol methylase